MLPNIDILDEFIELAKEAMPAAKDKDQLKKTQKREIELWHNWNTNGRKPEHLKPLFESFKPLIQKEVNRWRGLELPTSSIQAEFRKQFVNAVKTYDPKKAGLNTWIQNQLPKGSRFIKKYQNLGKIPEQQISRIRDFNLARDHLIDTHGFEPDSHALADHLKWPVKRVAQLQKELSRKDKPASGFPDDPAESMTPKELEAIHILQYDTRLTNDERSVYEYTFGMNGKSKLQPGQIAKQTKIHPSKISRIRGKLKTYINEAIEVL